MQSTTAPMAMVCPWPASAGNCSSQPPSLWAIVAPPKAPARTPTSVIPTCTVERNLLGSATSLSATRAPRLPRPAR